MAQYDTGLGWSAKDEWLIQTAGQIAQIQDISGGYVLDTIPNATYADIMSESDWVFYRPATGYRDGIKAVSVEGLVFGFIHQAGNGIWTPYFISKNPNAKVRWAWNTSSTYNQTSSFTSWTARPGWYYGSTGTGITSATTRETDLPVYTGSWQDALSAAIDALQISIDNIYKLNPGFSVACVAKWYTTEGAVFQSPVLISSAPELTVMTLDGTTPHPDMAINSFLLDGRRFYMATIANIDPDATIDTLLLTPDLTQFGAAAPSKVFALLANESFSNILIVDAPDPYGDTAGEDGGEQTDPEDDPVEEETLLIPAVVGLGFSTIYVPTQADLYNLAAYLWGGNLDLDNFLKLFANPMDSILGLSAVPLVLSGTYEPIYLGGQQLQGITMPRYTGRTAVKVDMGTVTIKERWGAYLDYDPYTELAIYVPFVGIKNIKTDDVMGKTIRLMYDIDILSGACIAYIRPEGGSPLYEWSGQCAMQIPITGANWDNIFSTAINTVATLGGALFAPASAPVLGGAVASAASQAIAAKPRIERSGAVNGITGFLGQLRPYIIRTIPEAYIPNDQNKFIGYPSYVSVNLGSLSGYNEIASIHLENIPATGDELAELESILKGGVIF